MKNSLAKGAAFNAIYQGLNVIFPLISATYVARVLAPEGVGTVSYAQNIVSYFVLLAALGLPTYGTREIAVCRENRNALNKVFSELFLVSAISTAICAGTYFSIVTFFIGDNKLLFYICGLELVFNFINVDWFYRGKEEYVYIAVRSISVKLVSLLFLFLFVKDPGDCAAYALVVCLANGCNYIFNVFRLKKSVRLSFRELDLKRHLGPLVTLLICSVSASLYSKIDITMLGTMSTEESVGLYSTAQKTMAIAVAVISSVTSVFLPRISFYYNNDREKFKEYVTLALKIVVFLAVPACVGIGLVSGELMAVLFGAEFLSGASIIKYLAALIIIKGVGDILCYQVLVSAGKEKYFLPSYIAAAILNMILNGLLIPHLDYDGAAIASVASELLVNATLLWWSRKEVKTNVSARFYLSVLFSAAAMTGCVLLMQYVVNGSVQTLLLSVLLGAVVYLLCNVIFKNEIVCDVLCKLKSKQGH